ncbi:MAG: oligoendopeptidase F [Clostridia bacterium]|nr:oligoendopeptidase F [Clostridia bacterium]
MALKARSEMDARYTWDLTPIFKNEEEFNASLAATMAATDKFTSFAGHLGDSIETLLDCYKMMDDVSLAAERIYVYAFLLKSGDGGDAKAQELSAKAINLLVKLQTVTSYIQPEILAIPEETLRTWMADERMKNYRFGLSDVLRARTHTLSAAEEALLAKLGDAQNTPSNAYDMLTDVDIVHSEIKNEKGETVRLTPGTFGLFRESADRRVREDAFNAYFGDYKQYNNTFAELYGGSVKLDCFNASARNFDSALSGALFGGNVPTSVYHSLIDAIHDGLPTMKKYLALRAKIMQRPELDMYDLYVPMIPDAMGNFPLEDGQKLVKEALKPLGEDYAKMLDRAFAERWIDVYENRGKASGAFSIGVFGVHPYVMLNYTDALEDVFTMAHELGHSMHSWYSDTTQPYATHDYRIMVAEVASTVNEVLLSKYLLKTETDKKRRAAILNKLCEGFRTTVYRQTLFAEFEMKTHEMYEKGEPLTAEALNKTYKALVETYYDGARVPEMMQYEWSYIPHFYRAFYVYQYATGFCSAVAIANRIYETGDASEYLRFLTTGGSDYPIEELKIAGVDLTSPKTVADALRVFDETLDELAELLG